MTPPKKLEGFSPDQMFSMSYWLKDAIATASDRDVCDALNDAEFLVGYLRQRMQTARGSR